MERTAGNCRQCSSRRLRLRGRLPFIDSFAGIDAAAPTPGGLLVECKECGLVCRHPVGEQADYDAVYAKASGENWVSARPRLDRSIISEFLMDRVRVDARILDIGCFDGQLLDSLPARYELFGIEPGLAAASLARKKGINILGASLDAPNLPEGGFDAVLAVDVIEHLVQPKLLIERGLSLARPGGWLLVSSGDSSAWSFRMAGGRYWYSAVAEHLSFISPRWARRLDLRNKVDHLEFRRFRYYADVPRNNRVAVGYFLTAVKSGLLRTARSMAGRPEVPPDWTLGSAGQFRDHFLVCIQKSKAP
jgi:SAM-dependent methyltransferase